MKKDNFTFIREYALWYYDRYFPSDKKLFQKIGNRCYEIGLRDGEKDTLQQEVFESLENILCEDKIVAAKIENYKARGKSMYYIRNKMAEKFFAKQLVEEKIAEIFSHEDELLGLEKEYQKLSKKYAGKENAKQKTLSALTRKGFRYDDVKRITSFQ